MLHKTQFHNTLYTLCFVTEASKTNYGTVLVPALSPHQRAPVFGALGKIWRAWRTHARDSRHWKTEAFQSQLT